MGLSAPSKPAEISPEIPANNNNIISLEENNNNNNNNEIKQIDTSKCWKCNKKIGIYGYQCRCKYFFCDKHRYNDLHNCSFDYNEFQKANLVVKLEKVVERKVTDI